MAKLIQNKWMLVFLILNLYTYKAMAQYSADDDNDRLFFGGLALGGNFAQVDGDNFAGYHRAGFNGGAIVYLNLGKPLALSMELLFAQKGSRAAPGQLPRLSSDKVTLITDYRIRTNYAEIPILLNFFDRRKSNFGAGVSYAQLVGSKESYTDSQGNVFEQDAKIYPFRKYDLDFVLSGNVHLVKGLFFNIRFQYSLVPIRKNYNFITSGRPQQFNNVWATRFVYLF